MELRRLPENFNETVSIIKNMAPDQSFWLYGLRYDAKTNKTINIPILIISKMDSKYRVFKAIYTNTYSSPSRFKQIIPDMYEDKLLNSLRNRVIRFIPPSKLKYGIDSSENIPESKTSSMNKGKLRTIIKEVYKDFFTEAIPPGHTQYGETPSTVKDLWHLISRLPYGHKIAFYRDGYQRWAMISKIIHGDEWSYHVDGSELERKELERTDDEEEENAFIEYILDNKMYFTQYKISKVEGATTRHDIDMSDPDHDIGDYEKYGPDKVTWDDIESQENPDKEDDDNKLPPHGLNEAMEMIPIPSPLYKLDNVIKGLKPGKQQFTLVSQDAYALLSIQKDSDGTYAYLVPGFEGRENVSEFHILGLLKHVIKRHTELRTSLFYKIYGGGENDNSDETSFPAENVLNELRIDNIHGLFLKNREQLKEAEYVNKVPNNFNTFMKIVKDMKFGETMVIFQGETWIFAFAKIVVVLHGETINQFTYIFPSRISDTADERSMRNILYNLIKSKQGEKLSYYITDNSNDGVMSFPTENIMRQSQIIKEEEPTYGRPEDVKPIPTNSLELHKVLTELPPGHKMVIYSKLKLLSSVEKIGETYKILFRQNNNDKLGVGNKLDINTIKNYIYRLMDIYHDRLFYIILKNGTHPFLRENARLNEQKDIYMNKKSMKSMKKEQFQSLIKRLLKEEVEEREKNKTKIKSVPEEHDTDPDLFPHTHDTMSKEQLVADLGKIVHAIDKDFMVYWTDHDDIMVRARDLFQVRIVPRWEDSYNIEAFIRNEDFIRVLGLDWDQVKDFVKTNFSQMKETYTDVERGKSFKNMEDQTPKPDSGMPQKDKPKKKEVGTTKNREKNYKEDAVKNEDDLPDKPMKEVGDFKWQSDHKVQPPPKSRKHRDNKKLVVKIPEQG